MSKKLAFILAAAAVLVGDQTTKHYFITHWPLNQSWSYAKYFALTYIHNYGGAFGIFQGFAPLFITVGILVLIAVGYFFKEIAKLPWMQVLAMGLLVGGAFGNLCDRIRFGYVIDFLDFKVWPIFNVADSMICVSLGLLFISYLQSARTKANPS